MVKRCRSYFDRLCFKKKKRHRERQEERGHFFKARRAERGGICPGGGPPGPPPGPQGLRRGGGWAAPPGADRPPTAQAGTDVTTTQSRTTVRQRGRTEATAARTGHGQTETQGTGKTGKTSKALAGPPPPPPTPLTCHTGTFFRTGKIQLKAAQHARVSGHAKRKTMYCVPAGRRGA